MLPAPINLLGWIDEHRHLLKPPVGNKCIAQDDFIIMWFYQLEGEMVLRIQEDGAPRDIPIRAGEMFLLPPRVPHSPQRMPDSVGLVIERKRLAHEQDGLMWFCPSCNHKLYEEYFHLRDIETDLPPVFERFYASSAHRTCPQCGHVHPTPARYAAAAAG